MNEKLSHLFELLLKNEKSTITSTQISDHLGVSSRTVKRYISELNDILSVNGSAIESTTRGYLLRITNNSIFNEFVSNQKRVYRVMDIEDDNLFKIIKLLLSHKYITQDEISNQIYVSRSTISKDMIRIKEILDFNGFIISNRPHYGYNLIGDERKIRNYIAKLFFGNDEIFVVPEEFKINENDASRFNESLSKLMDKPEILKLNLNSNYLMKYLYININRMKNKAFISLKALDTAIDPVIGTLVDKITDLIRHCFDLTMTQEEKTYLSYLIGGTSVEEVGIDKQNDSLFEEIVDNFLASIKEVYQMDFSYDDSLRRGIIQHLYASYNRYYLNAIVVNPIITLIKSQYIEAYNYSVLCSKLLKEKYNLSTTEDDIGFLALHFAASLERSNAIFKYKVAVVCGSGYGTAELLKVRLKNEIPSLDVIGVYSSHDVEHQDLSDVSFIISTVKINTTIIKKPVVYINSLLQGEDIQQIKAYLSNYKDINDLKKVFRETLFFPQLKLTKKTDILEFVSRKMVDQHLMGDNQFVSLLEREEISSTEINSLVAIPHCIVSNDYNTSFAIVTTQKPVNWGRADVQLILFGVIASKSTVNKKIFPLIYKLTIDQTKVKKLVSIQSYEDFIELFFSDVPVDY